MGLARVVDVTGAVLQLPDSKTLFAHLHQVGGCVYAVARFGASSNPGQLIHLLGNNGWRFANKGIQIGYEDRPAVSGANDAAAIAASAGGDVRLVNHFNSGTAIFSGYNNRIAPQAFAIGAWMLNLGATQPNRGTYSHNGDAFAGGSTYAAAAATGDAAYDMTINGVGPGVSPAAVGLALMVSELIVFDALPPPSVSDVVVGYLAHKWGLAAGLAPGHPYKSNAPARWVAVREPSAWRYRDEFCGQGRIWGTTEVQTAPGVKTPAGGRVVLLRQRDKLLARQTWADPVTGAWAFEGLDMRQDFLVLAEDLAGNYRPVAANRLTPEAS
jgi:hypothetical protein